ncbi:hypothetical protein STCU_05287 [Strigomonas culicis]|uniref:RESC1/2 CYTH-like domain-containing protein n=1 Tax=Strigomonas culicis TaxID=28005 RepID=S9UGT5_9TRYP|nr:hypothetical protein STCU_05287 [Strigomonas culicis]|eukprot:EPY28128.1 hypothetical protein STCU_05287 [Strigomonas culicis]
MCTGCPGESQNKEDCFTIAKVDAYEANKTRFRRALEWCLLNSWNVNLPAELNMGAGKILFYQNLAKQNKRVLPLWTLQHHVAGQHPYAWFAVANERNARESVEGRLLPQLSMEPLQDETTTYRLSVRRMGESFDVVLNDNLQCVSVNRPWDRFFVSHYVRQRMPDVRFLVRARHPMKKKVADLYLESDILRRTRDSVQSVLIPELGDVTYCCERQVRKWVTRTPKTNTQIQLVETRRTPLIISRLGDEGQRLECEFIVPLPTKAERVDVAAFCDEMWEFGNRLAQSLEEEMADFMAHTMSTSATF